MRRSSAAVGLVLAALAAGCAGRGAGAPATTTITVCGDSVVSGLPTTGATDTAPAEACSSTPTPSTGPAVTPSTAQALCVAALGADQVTAWGDGTVGGFRAFSDSGPTPHVPLRDAFPGLAPSTPGAWCVTVSRDDPQAPCATWWAVTPGQAPTRAIGICGPNEPPQGDIDGPPRVP